MQAQTYIRYLLLVGISIFLGCSSQSLEPDDPVPGPHQTLIKIVQMSQKNDFTGLDDLLYGIQYAPDKNSRDGLRDGIMKKKKVGDFSFSVKSFLRVIHEARFKLVPIGDEALNFHFLAKNGTFHMESYLLKLATEDRKKIYHFQEGLSQLILAEVNGSWKLLFSKEMTTLGVDN